MPKEKIDLYKLHKDEYAAPRKPVIVTIKKANYLAIEGSGAPGSDLFQKCIGALYSAAFTIKMTRKFAGLQDYAVCKLEGLWWADSKTPFLDLPKDQWRWKLMIRTPDFIATKDLKAALEALRKRGKGVGVDRVRLEAISEGSCVQMLHFGPYDDEPETIELMRAHAAANKKKFCGLHHEIYLSDPRRVPANRLKTILRQPIISALRPGEARLLR